MVVILDKKLRKKLDSENKDEFRFVYDEILDCYVPELITNRDKEVDWDYLYEVQRDDKDINEMEEENGILWTSRRNK